MNPSRIADLKSCQYGDKAPQILGWKSRAFEQVFSPNYDRGGGGFDQRFSKNSYARGLPGGGDVQALI